MTEPTPETDNWQDFYTNPPPPQPPQSKPVNVKRIVALAVAVPIVALLVGWLVWWGRTPSEPTPPAAEPPAAQVPAELLEKLVPPSPTAPARKFTILDPAKLGGRAKSTDPELTKVASDMGARLKALPQDSTSVSAFYGSHAKKNLVLVLAGTEKVAQSDLDTLIKNSMVGVEEVKRPSISNAGPLGGYAECGEGKAQGIQISYCAWVDDGTIGIIAWYYKTMEKAQAEFHAMRAEVETIS